ncbi:MAG: hypothetical protein IT208_03350 [Chthonomonadales bacterium]|nr:hypothetical protein [Chthonomonadales bacterium]
MACGTTWLLAAGVSVGLYYTASYYGRAGGPVPTPVALAAPLAYYVALPASADTRQQALLWEAAFVACGVLWAATLCACGRAVGRRPPLSGMVCVVGAVGWPLLAPLPWMAAAAGATPSGWRWSQLLDVCLRRAWMDPAPWMHAAYFAAGLAALGFEALVLRRILGRGCLPYAVAGALLFLLITMCAALGAAWLLGP